MASGAGTVWGHWQGALLLVGGLGGSRKLDGSRGQAAERQGLVEWKGFSSTGTATTDFGSKARGGEGEGRRPNAGLHLLAVRLGGRHCRCPADSGPLGLGLAGLQG